MMAAHEVVFRHVGCLLFVATASGQEAATKAPAARADAAPIYGLALGELRQRFGIAADGALELPWPEEGEQDDAQRRFAADEWQPALANAGAAM